MTQTHWAIRFFLPFEENTNIAFVGNFEAAGSRFLDDIIVFSGMYGIPDHMIWYIHKDLSNYDFSSYSMELRLFVGGDPKTYYFSEKYRIYDVRDDLNSNRKVVYAIQEDYAKLDTLLIDSEIGTLNFNETRTVEQLFRDILETSGIFPIIFCEHKDFTKKSIEFEYKNFTLDPKWTVRDFIQYVADENNFEWTIKYGILFIGPEIYTYKSLKASKDYFNKKVDNISRNYHNLKITWSASPLDVMYHYEHISDEKLIDYRCIWAKHWVGKNGDTTKGCFVQVGRKIGKDSYYETLEGKQEISDSLRYMFNVPKFDAISIVRSTSDSGDNKFVDEITLQKNIPKYNKKVPRDITMDIITSAYKLPKVGRTTPYADDKAGLFFPRPKSLLKNPNQLLFSPYNRIEQSILGPFVLGNGSPSFIIPSKNPDDFRLQLPDGFCIYKKNEDFLYIQLLDTLTTIPIQDNSKIHIYLDKDGNIRINQDSTTYFEIDSNKNIKLQQSNDCYLELDKDGNITIQKDSNNKIVIDQTGKITFDFNGDLEINCNNATINAQVKAEVDAPTVDIGPTATMVNIAGGSNFLPTAIHTHQVAPGPAIPGPPATATPTTNLTTKTKAT